MSIVLGQPAKLAVVCTLAALITACGVRGNLVPPEGRDVLVETSGSETRSDDDARFPAPEPVEEN